MSKITGKWNVTVHTYMGDQRAVHEYTVDGDKITAVITDGANGASTRAEGTVDGDKFTFTFTLKVAIGEMTFTINGELVDDNTIKGTSGNAMGSFDFDGVRA